MTKAEKAARVQEYLAMRKAGKSDREIGKHFGVMPQAIWKALKYLQEPNFRSRISQRSAKRTKERYHSDPEYRAKILARATLKNRSHVDP